VVPGPVELSPEVGGADQRAERDGGERRCPTARAGLRRVPHVRSGAPASAPRVARGPGSRPAGRECGAPRGQRAEDRVSGRRAAAAFAGDGAITNQSPTMTRLGLMVTTCVFIAPALASAQQPP